MTINCEAGGDASNFRTSGCFYSMEDCPIKGKKTDSGLEMKFFAEQKIDDKGKWKDEMFHMYNPASPNPGSGEADAHTKSTGDRQAVHDGHVDADEFISRDPKAAKNDRAENCTQNKGRLAGIGPSCDVGERGQADLHKCVFVEVARCESLRQLCRGNAITYQKMSAQFQGQVDVAQPPIGDTTKCDQYYKECVEQTTKQCVCSDCEFDSCMYDCDDTGDPTDPTDPTDPHDPKTETDYDIGPKLYSVAFTDSSYDTPIPIIYGRYITAGNIIWAGDPTQTEVTERTETVDGDTTRVHITIRYIYHGSMAVALCEGPISGLLRVWIGETLLFSRTLSVDEAGNVEPTDGVLVDEIENMLLFSAGSDDEAYYDQTRMRVSLFTGADDQLAPAIMGDNAPAYRGLAYLLFENFNLTYLGAKVPQLRIEISQIEATTSMPRTITDLVTDDFEGARTDMMFADIQSNSLYVMADPAPGNIDVFSGVRKLRLDTLEEISSFYDEDGDIDAETFHIYNNGVVGYQRANGNLQRETVFIRPETNTVLYRYGYDDNITGGEGAVHLTDTLGALSRATQTFTGYAVERYGFDPRMFTIDAVAAVSQAASVDFDYFDGGASAFVVPNTNYRNLNDAVLSCEDTCDVTCAELHCTGSEAGEDLFCTEPAYSECIDDCYNDCTFASSSFYAPFASIMTETYYPDPDVTIPIQRRRQHIDIFTLQPTTQGELRIFRVDYTDTGGTDNNTALLDEIPDAESISVPASVWGGEPNVTGLFVIHDQPRGHAVIFLGDGAGGAHVFALQTSDYLTSDWYVHIESFPGFTSPGRRMLPYPADFFRYVDGDGNIVELDMEYGETNIIGSLTAEGLPGVGGAQLYDPGRNSITYITDEDVARVVRVYPQRAIPAHIGISTIIRDIAIRSGLDPDFIDVSDIEDIQIIGIGIFGNLKPSSVIEQLVNMFNLSVWEQDGFLVVRKRATGDSFELNENDFISKGPETYRREDVDPYIEPRKLTLNYADIDNFCRSTSVLMSQQITPDPTVYAIGHVKLETAAALEPQQAYEIAERYFVKLHSLTDTISFALPARLNDIMPNDTVRITFSDTEPRLYRVVEVTFDAARAMAAYTAVLDKSYLDADNISSVPWEDPNKYRVQKAFRKLNALTIRTFFVPPYTDVDMLASATHHVVYGGVQSEVDQADFDTVGLAVRALNGSERIHEVATQSGAPLQLGRSLTLLPADGGTFDTDTTTQFQVRFRRADILSKLTNATKSELLEDRTRNALLVGREWIQFQNVSYDSGTGVHTFSGLFRGRNGTDTFVDTHNVGEEVVYPTVTSFRPMYIHYQRMTQQDSISIRLTSMQTVQVSGKPVIFASNTDSIRPWAPTNIDRWRSNVNLNDIVVTFNYRGKHDGELQDNDVPTYEPTPVIYGENRDAAGGAYTRRYVVYFSRHQFGVPPLAEVEAMIRGREELLQSVFGGYSRLEINGDTEGTFPQTSHSSISYNAAVNTLYVYVAQIGGPANNKVGFIGRAIFPPGTYATLPLGPKMRVRKATTYVVLSPDNLKVYDAGLMLVLRP